MADLISAIVTSYDRKDALTVVRFPCAPDVPLRGDRGVAVLHNDRRLPAVLGSDGARMRSGVPLTRALPAAR